MVNRPLTYTLLGAVVVGLIITSYMITIKNPSTQEELQETPIIETHTDSICGAHESVNAAYSCEQAVEFVRSEFTTLDSVSSIQFIQEPGPYWVVQSYLKGETTEIILDANTLQLIERRNAQ